MIDSSSVWQPCQQRGKGMQLPHSSPLPRLQPANGWDSTNSGMRYCGFSAWLLQRPALWCTSGDAQQVTKSAEQLGESRLPTWRSIGCQTSSAVVPLAARVAPHHIQDRRSRTQGSSNVNASIPQQPHKPQNPQDIYAQLAPLLSVPRTRTDGARRAFSVATPSVWNFGTCFLTVFIYTLPPILLSHT